MILLFRKYLVKIFLLITFLTVIFGAVFYVQGLRNGTASATGINTRQIWWMVYGRTSGFNIQFLWMILMACSLYSLTVGLYVYRQIKKNPAPQLAFLYLFIFTFSLHIFRLYYLIPQNLWFPLNKYYITRIIYFSRFFGLTAFFAASLFTTGLQIQKFAYVLLITILISFSLAVIIPINTIELTSSLLFRIAGEKSIALFFLALEILTVLNYLSAAVKQVRGEFYQLIIFCIMILAGYEMIFFLYTPFLIPGALLLTGGTVLYIRTSQKLYLWS